MAALWFKQFNMLVNCFKGAQKPQFMLASKCFPLDYVIMHNPVRMISLAFKHLLAFYLHGNNNDLSHTSYHIALIDGQLIFSSYSERL